MRAFTNVRGPGVSRPGGCFSRLKQGPGSRTIASASVSSVSLISNRFHNSQALNASYVFISRLLATNGDLLESAIAEANLRFLRGGHAPALCLEW